MRTTTGQSRRFSPSSRHRGVVVFADQSAVVPHLGRNCLLYAVQPLKMRATPQIRCAVRREATMQVCGATNPAARSVGWSQQPSSGIVNLHYYRRLPGDQFIREPMTVADSLSRRMIGLRGCSHLAEVGPEGMPVVKGCCDLGHRQQGCHARDGLLTADCLDQVLQW